MAEIRLDGVTKRYPNGSEPLKNASFTVHDGEFFILVGPSGCGKSTLLNLIAGLEEISEGEIRVDGVCINELDPRERNMAMVFQSYAIYPHLNVRENMAFPLRMAKLPGREIDRRVHQAAAVLELEDLLERKPATLSGGQRQRVAMGRAMVREPKAFLLDEPLSNLDARLRVQMRTEIARLHARLRATMIYVTHDQTEAMTLGDRVAVLDQGSIQQIGTPQVLYERPANLFVASFLGSPAMNFLPASIKGAGIVLPIAEIRLPGLPRFSGAIDAPALCIGIRPEHIAHADSAGADRNWGAVFEATIEVVEWLGADAFVHFQVPAPAAERPARLLDELRITAGTPGTVGVTARLDPGFPVREGDKVPLWLDTRKLHFFDGQTGLRLEF